MNSSTLPEVNTERFNLLLIHITMSRDKQRLASLICVMTKLFIWIINEKAGDVGRGSCGSYCSPFVNLCTVDCLIFFRMALCTFNSSPFKFQAMSPRKRIFRSTSKDDEKNLILMSAFSGQYIQKYM